MVWSNGLSPSGGVRVEHAALAAGGHGHAHRVADALAQRPGGGLDAARVAVLGVTRGQRAPRAEGLQVVELQAVAGQVELDVEGEAASGPRTGRTGRGRPSSGRSGRAAATRWNSRYAAGARLIAVPGCPLPTFWTASMASTRTVSMARRSSSPKPSGRVGWGCEGLPVGESLGGLGRGLRLGALRSHVVGAPSGWPCCLRRRGAPGWFSLGTGARRRRRRPTAATRGINADQPVVGAHCCARRGDRPRATVAPVPVPGSKGPRAVQSRRRRPPRDRAVRARRRARRAGPPSALRARRWRVPRADQAADHRAAPGHHRSGDDAGRAGAGPRGPRCCGRSVGGTLAAGAANVFNCYYDRDIDKPMHRTAAASAGHRCGQPARRRSCSGSC